MVFSSKEFLFIFMPAFFAVYLSVPKRFKNGVLLLGSLLFYLFGTLSHPLHFAVFIACVFADWAFGRLMCRFKGKAKLFLSVSVILHLANLAFFKYIPFAVNQVAEFLPFVPFMSEAVLPIGISFYTFQGISYLADVARGKTEAEKNPIDYFVYISMFEQLIAGPIVTYQEVKDSIHDREITAGDVIRGLEIFSFGLGFKVLLANPVGKLWTQLATIGYESVSTPLAWLGIFAFTFQIYFDFYGYSLMAIGLGKMLGFNIPKNFDDPYTSATMTEFWRRWHITLGSWFREYVYIPLGGNRKGNAATIRNMLIVWLLTGIWHGAGYNYILWGLILFLIMLPEKLLWGDFLSRHRLLGRACMTVIVPLTWAVFAIEDMGQLGIFFTRLFPFFGQGPWSVFRYDYLKYLGEYWYFLLAGALFSCRFPYKAAKKIKCEPIRIAAAVMVFAFSAYFVYRGANDPFLYYRF